MDFTFNEDQQAILDAVKEFCDEDLAPKAKETDEAAAWPAVLSNNTMPPPETVNRRSAGRAAAVVTQSVPPETVVPLG